MIKRVILPQYDNWVHNGQYLIDFLFLFFYQKTKNIYSVVRAAFNVTVTKIVVKAVVPKNLNRKKKKKKIK